MNYTDLMLKGLDSVLGNGRSLSDLNPAEFGNLLDNASRGLDVTDPIELAMIFNDAKRRGVEPRVYGELAPAYMEALTKYNNSKVRTDLVKYNFDRLSQEQIDYLVEYGNSSVRCELATNHSGQLTAPQLQALLNAPEGNTSGNAYFYGFSQEVRDRLEDEGIVVGSWQNKQLLKEADPEVLEPLIYRPGRTPDAAAIDVSIAILAERAKTFWRVPTR